MNLLYGKNAGGCLISKKRFGALKLSWTGMEHGMLGKKENNF